MRLMNYLFCVLLSAMPFCAFAQSFSMSPETEKALHDLDVAIENKKEYQERLSERIDSIKNVLDKCRKDEYVDNCKQLFDLSFHYSGRASLNALQNILLTPEAKQDTDLRVGAQLHMASVYSVMGLYGVVIRMLRNIEEKDISDTNKQIYYHTIYNNHVRLATYESNILSRADDGTDSVRLALLDSP